MKLNIKGFEVQILETKSGKKLLINTGDRDCTELDKCIRQKFNVRKMIETDEGAPQKMRCYILK